MKSKSNKSIQVPKESPKGLSVSSTFYRLQKDIGMGHTAVREFHTVIRTGVRYIIEREEFKGMHVWRGKPQVVSAEEGNRIYKHFKQKDGYSFGGIYYSDTCGYTYPVSEVA